MARRTGRAGLLPDDRMPPHLRRPDRERFCPYSLGDWLEAAQATGIPTVAGERIATFEREDLRNHEYDGPHQARLDRAYAEVFAHHAPGTMFRWDCCASASLKLAMAEGRSPGENEEARHCLPIDARLLEVLEEWPRVAVPAWQRPWIGEIQHREGRYPREYRAFVRNGTLAGVSAYYPQQAVTHYPEELEAVAEYARRLAETLEGPFQWPARTGEMLGAMHMVPKLAGSRQKQDQRDGLQPDSVHFTADFAATRNGVLLLEEGPPHELGAHPCCFEGRRIDGVLLDRNGETMPVPATRARQGRGTEENR